MINHVLHFNIEILDIQNCSGVVVTKLIFSVLLLSNFLEWSKYSLPVIACSYLTGVSVPEPRRHLTNMNVIESINIYENENFPVINERSFSNPHPWNVLLREVKMD